MILRLGRNPDGTRATSENEPARGRVAGYGSSAHGHAMTISGALVQGDPGATERQRQAQREFKARHK